MGPGKSRRSTVLERQADLLSDARHAGMTETVTPRQAQIQRRPGDIRRQDLEQIPLSSGSQGTAEGAQLNQDEIRAEGAKESRRAFETIGIAVLDSHKHESPQGLRSLQLRRWQPEAARSAPR
jgi:hypothetical protein